MMYLHWRAMSWAAPVPLSMRYASRMVSLSRSSFGITSTLVGGGAHITPGYAGDRGNSSEPITVVQCGGLVQEEGQYSVFLC